MNSVVLVGRLTRDPERKDAGVTQVCNFTVAINRRTKDGGADFINCTAFGNSAKFVSEYFTKGKWIALDGHINTSTYDKKDGTKGYSTKVIADHVEFAGNKADAPAPDPEEFESAGDEGLPFFE